RKRAGDRPRGRLRRARSAPAVSRGARHRLVRLPERADRAARAARRRDPRGRLRQGGNAGGAVGLPGRAPRRALTEMSALLTDLYQLTMMQAYLERGMQEPAVFELFVRKLPAQ